MMNWADCRDRAKNYRRHSFPTFYLETYYQPTRVPLCLWEILEPRKTHMFSAAMHIQIGSIGALLQSSNFITRIVLPLSWSCLFHLFYMVRDYNVRGAPGMWPIQPKPNLAKDDPAGRESELAPTRLLSSRGITSWNQMRERHFQNGRRWSSITTPRRSQQSDVMWLCSVREQTRGRPRWMATLIGFFLAGKDVLLMLDQRRTDAHDILAQMLAQILRASTWRWRSSLAWKCHSWLWLSAAAAAAELLIYRST